MAVTHGPDGNSIKDPGAEQKLHERERAELIALVYEARGMLQFFAASQDLAPASKAMIDRWLIHVAYFHDKVFNSPRG